LIRLKFKLQRAIALQILPNFDLDEVRV